MNKTMKLTCLLLTLLLLAGCGTGADPQVEAVRQQIQALPTVEQFQALSEDAQLEAYNATQAAYDAYMALSEDQKTQLPDAEETVEALFSYYNTLVMPLPEVDSQVEAVQAQLQALPTVEQFQALSEDAQLEAYNATQAAYDAYMALTQDQKAQLPDAEAIFEALFAYYNTLIMPLEETAPAVNLSVEDQELLLKIGMAELGSTECTQCIALVMRTVLNRVESDRFPDSVYKVLHSPEQFTPVGDGTFAAAVPNEACRAALDMILQGWDESQGALYYEFCQGESWHSKNLQLLTEHCNTRFYQ